jgi:putative oxidoreductase
VNRPLPGAARDVALLLTRLLLGTTMFAHGYQKLVIDGLGRTAEGFESMSIPVAILSAAFVTVVEVVGSVLVVLGALIPVVAACYLVVMVGAAVFVHIPNGIFAGAGGWELVGAITAVLLALAAAGSGRYGVDHLVRVRQVRTAAADASSAVTTTFRSSIGRRPGRTTRRARRRSSSRRPTVRLRHVARPPGRRRCPSPDAARSS